MYKWIDHIVVRVKDLDEGMRSYEGKLGMKASKGPDEIPELGMKRAIFPLGDSGRFIELAEPLGDDSAIGRSLERQGEGLHLVALAVDDMAAAAAEMKANGARLIEAGNMVFVHPADSHGVLYQLIERG
ncbi:MAG: VOC family protein [Alphaproteobacteria bacterium]|jgi:methylmalonyl-CoA epimerase|nr:VOC family protein [Alphaproteobacteria bacterium]